MCLQVLLKSLILSTAGSAGFGLFAAWMLWLFVVWMGQHHGKTMWRGEESKDLIARTGREEDSEESGDGVLL
jgi:hypothetical protein